MSDTSIHDIWPEWEIVRRIGSGSYGVVHEAKKRDFLETKAAIKVISIPQNESELDSLRADGMTEEASRTYMERVKNDFIREIQLMYEFKGTQNIVSIEDYAVVEKKDQIGWDIYIRMELLTPFTQYISGKALTESEVIQFGIDMCNALELCEKNNVIHRDIKPENIFVNKHGDFKLGDFGIARKLENVTGGLSQKGALNYMAPEVVHGMHYDNTVDIYSLGLVLYRLCNHNCLPFLTPETQQDPRARVEAVRCRLDGVPLSRPAQASQVMWDVIQCACNSDSRQRFTSAGALKKALEIAEETAGKASPVVPTPPIPHVAPNPPASGLSIGLRIIIFILSVVLLAIISVIVITSVLDNNSSNEAVENCFFSEQTLSYLVDNNRQTLIM